MNRHTCIRESDMKRILAPQSKIVLAIAALVFTIALGAGVASAVSPHFISASGSLSGTDLVCSFKEAGLGTNQLINYECDATGDAIYVCVNHGGANPSASNKTEATGEVSGTGAFNSGKNGNVNGKITVEPPETTLTCPPGQSLEIASVTYTNISITDLTNGITESIPGTVSSGCLLPNVRGAC
jgi:hypothetical protein